MYPIIIVQYIHQHFSISLLFWVLLPLFIKYICCMNMCDFRRYSGWIKTIYPKIHPSLYLFHTFLKYTINYSLIFCTFILNHLRIAAYLLSTDKHFLAVCKHIYSMCGTITERTSWKLFTTTNLFFVLVKQDFLLFYINFMRRKNHGRSLVQFFV